MEEFAPIVMIGNDLIFIQWFILCNALCQHRLPRLPRWTLEVFAVVLCVWLGSILPYMSLIRILYMPVLFFIAFRILYRDPWYKLLFYVAVLLSTLFVVEMLVAPILYTPEVMAGQVGVQPIRLQLLIYGALVIANAMINGTLYLLFRRKTLRLEPKQLILCAGFFVCQFFCLVGYLRESTLSPHYDTAVYSIIGIFANVVLDVFLIHYVVTIGYRERLQTENALLSEQIVEQKNRYSTITAEYEAVRQMRHDISKHLTTMEALLEKNRGDEAAHYIAQLQENCYASSPQICENPVVDALLSAYRNRAARMGLTLTPRVQLPAETGIADTDLICALGNLLDNALEACSGQTGSEIRLSCAVRKGYLVISLENPPEASTEKARHTDGLERGVGTRVLTHLAEKYGGSYTAETEQDLFRARLTLTAKEA